MEDVLELYEESHDPKRPVVCFDEMPYQMVAEKRLPLPAKPGRQPQYSHSGLALYKAFEPEEARRVLRKLEFHHTPKHASWLNQVEIEFSVLSRQCLDRRIPDESTLKREGGAWERKRNEEEATVAWRFTALDAREKLERLYPPRS